MNVTTSCCVWDDQLDFYNNTRKKNTFELLNIEFRMMYIAYVCMINVDNEEETELWYKC